MKTIGNPRRLAVDVCVVFTLAAVVWFFWLREPRTEDLQGVKSVHLSMRYLWDPASPELHEWQVLGNPQDILLGPHGDLFISDGDQAKVLRCTSRGEFIEIIGRRGAGPGEFEECWDLGYCSSDSTLWVVDRSTVRGSVSRFKLTPSSSQYIDRFTARNTWLQTRPNLVVQDAHSFWVHDRSSRVDMRILHINDDGEVISSFGELYKPPEATTERERWMISAYSLGFPELAGQDTLIFIYMSRPVMELWSISGQLLHQVEFDLPEVRSITRHVEQQRREMQNPEVTPVYFQTAVWHPESAALYVMTSDVASNRQVIYGVDAKDLRILTRYLVDIEFGENFLACLAVESTPAGLRFFSIDVLQAGVVVLEPVEQSAYGL